MTEPIPRHEHAVGDVLVDKITGYSWTISNRMHDVDTDELLYFVRGEDSTPSNEHGRTKIVTASEIKREDSQYRVDD